MNPSQHAELLSLLVEYKNELVETERALQELGYEAIKSGQESHDSDDVDAILTWLSERHGAIVRKMDRLQSDLRKLAARASQLVEHGEMTESERLQLRLRLADLDSHMGSIPRVAKATSALVNSLAIRNQRRPARR